ncbi:MAG TPA: helix-hairpin-helix domain-containing protein [Sedimentisphaerales bacterium]|nr:helix-hairpin-helix domain-containing protein [Sedimentisphaerales bacterium]
MLKKMCTNGNNKGLVLVAVLWVVVVLMVLVAVLGRKSRLDTKVCLARTEAVRCKWACRAGIEKAVGVLNEDTRESDCLTDLWSDNEEDFNDIWLQRCWFTVRVVDEASKLNINTATKGQLLELPEMLEEIADSIIDWRDEDDTPSEGGAEGGYYENLPFGYMARNGPFRTIRELLMIKDVTPELFFGEDTNFNDQLDYNEQDGDESPPNDDGDSELDKGWIAYLTCYSYDNNKDADGNQKININNANENQLTSSLNIRSSQARWIVENRPNNGYQSIGDLINRNSPQTAQAAQGGSDRNSNENEAEQLDLQTFSQIADKITVDDSQKVPGKVNVNTASEIVLAALLGGGDSAEQTAQEIIAYREALLYGMQSIAELMQVPSMNIDTFKNIAGFITTRSDVFTIRCLATADRNMVSGATLETEAVVDRSSSPYKVLYWYQGASN